MSEIDVTHQTIRPADVVAVRVEELQPGISPRRSGLDEGHVQLLAAVLKGLPPLLVQRTTMQVVDGCHRLAAAKLRGDRTVDVVLWDGSDVDCFVESVRANVRHGKPLTLSERRQAAVRMLEVHPEWSDRALAEACGLAAGTIASVRHCATAQIEQSRVCRDGRFRPLDTSNARLRAAELMAENPEASLRHVARTIGVSAATVRDVRDRVQRGESPVVLRAAGANGRKGHGSPPPRTLHTDLAFTHSAAAQTFASWFDEHGVTISDWQTVIDDVPLSRLYGVVDEARRRARVWEQLAACAEDRVRRHARGSKRDDYLLSDAS
jgi:ParB-like chromosome segregation protein Spo0J